MGTGGELRRQLGVQLDRAARHRWPLLAGWLVLFAVLTTADSGDGDWEFFRRGTSVLFGHAILGRPGGVHLYASMPAIQIGPPALVAALSFDWLPRPWDVDAARVVMVAALLLIVWLAERTCRAIGVPPEISARGTLIGGVLLAPAWMAVAITYTHLDDVLVLVFTVAAMLFVARDRPLWAATAIGLAAATKPWGVVVAPLLLQFGWRRSLAYAGLAAAVALAWWLPFLADPRTLSALWGFRVSVGGNSGLTLFGVRPGPMPSWVRPVQFLGGLALGALATRRGSWTGVPLVGWATRVALDPIDSAYYDVAPIVAALVFDLTRSKSGVPWTTIVAVAGFSLASSLGHSPGVVWIRVGTCVAVAVAVVVRRPARATRASRHPALALTVS
jgi:hypothetical protein